MTDKEKLARVIARIKGDRLRVLVCGGRDFTDRHAVITALERLAQADEYQMLGRVQLTVIHGCCRTGADRFASDWAAAAWAGEEGYQAEWDDLSHPDARIKVNRLGKPYDAQAGHRRNTRMLVGGKPDVVLAFPTGGPGTRDMMKQARAAGVPVIEHRKGTTNG